MADEDSSADGHAATAAGEPTSGAPRAGATFAGRYVVERLLGRGGMGAVWAAIDRQLGEPVALKILDGGTGHSTTAVERFRAEVRLARRVTHKNVARIFDIGDHGGTLYLTMELVRGTSLAEKLAASGRLSVARAIDIARQIGEGLAAAHDAGVVHRDLKPGNILLAAATETSGEGRVALTDFGIAFGLTDNVRVTVDHAALLGTPAYMAPEQVRGGAVDARTDLYALGLVLYEMTTGVMPFVCDTALQAAIARLDRPPVDPRAHATMPDALAELILECLKVDPAARPTSARAFVEQLGRIAAPADPTTSTGIPIPARPAQTASTTLSPAAGAATLAVLPLRYRGPAGDEYMAETLTDELIDLLSATRGLKVMASGATAKYAGDRDPFTVGRELGVDVVVDGTLHRSGTQIRISARLVDVASGFQTWNGRFDGELKDVFELQDLVAKKIAETLRVELETDRLRGGAPVEAVDLYLRARALTRKMNDRSIQADTVVPLYDQCLALAPDFAPALAGRATACLRGWFRPEGTGDARERAARAAVGAAQHGAPRLAETHLAVARLAVQDGRFREAAAALTEALHIAPTYPEAHEYAGSLMCEAGRPDRGIRHLRLAAELDPGSTFGLLVAARHHALSGERAEAEALLSRLRNAPGVPANGLRMTEIRICAWFGEHERMRELGNHVPPPANGGAMFAEMLKAYLGTSRAADSIHAINAFLGGANPRFRAMAEQFSTEALCSQGETALAWTTLQSAASGVLVDLHWLDHCPLLGPVRAHPDYPALREVVRQRAESIWGVL